jgi:hypothetical protein
MLWCNASWEDARYEREHTTTVPAQPEDHESGTEGRLTEVV